MTTKTPTRTRQRGLEHRERMRERSRAQSRASAEIGPPPITSKQRAHGTRLRKKCRHNLELFNSIFFPNSTGLKPFGTVQKDSIAHDQQVILHGGRICKAEPRGYGKTTRTGNAALWGVCYGYRRMIPVFSASMDKSKSLMDRWQTEILTNDLLLWSFPDLIWPLRALENRGQRCASQTFNNQPTFTAWTSDKIVFPNVPGVPGAGAVLIALPLKSCRGAIHATPTGEVLRPDLVIFDDVSTDEDAENPHTTKKLEDLIDHTAMMLGGHHQTISAIMSCTVRCEGDLSEQYLAKPSWRRVRYKLLASPAELEKEFWLSEYAETRSAYDPEDPDDQIRAHREALRLYQANRANADRGAVVTWDWAYAWNDEEPTEISAIQHAYNLLIDNGEQVFASECQNAPKRDSKSDNLLTASEIVAKVSPPAPDATTLTAFVDIGDHILTWEVWAWSQDESGYQITAGNWPDQRRPSFNYRIPPIPLEKVYPNMSLEARITHALQELLHGSGGKPGLMSTDWTIGDAPHKIRCCLVDANGTHRDLIVRVLTNSPYSASLFPSFGYGIGAKKAPISAWQEYKRQRTGGQWIFTKAVRGERVGVVFDTNCYKSRWHQRLALPTGTKGGLYLKSADDIRMAAEQYLSEYPTLVEANGRSVAEWQLRPNLHNHRFDAAVGNMVASLVAGVGRVVAATPTKQRKRKTTYF